MGASDSWISWPEAAELVGCPVPTIEWHTRTGRIEHRPARGQRPSLKRDSVEAFAVWWAERQATRRRKRDEAERRSKEWLEPPEPTGWLSTQQAADVLDVNRGQVQWLIANDLLRAVKTGRRLWVDEESVKDRAGAHAADSNMWISQVEAARIVGCSPQTISRAAQDGRIERRETPRSFPSLSRRSVVAFAESRHSGINSSDEALETVAL